jgi:hypothetical protein
MRSAFREKKPKQAGKRLERAVPGCGGGKIKPLSFYL